MQRKSKCEVWKIQQNILDLVNAVFVQVLDIYLKYIQIHKSCCKCMRFLSKVAPVLKNYAMLCLS